MRKWSLLVAAVAIAAVTAPFLVKGFGSRHVHAADTSSFHRATSARAQLAQQFEPRSLRSVSCLGATVCLAAGATRDGKGVIERSSDKGRIWEAIKLPPGVPALNEVTCHRARDCLAVGGRVVLRSLDGGLTWKTDLVASTGTDLYAVVCMTSADCLMAGAQERAAGPTTGIVMSSTDAGATWASTAVPVWLTGLGAISCVSTEVCVAVGDTVARSADGGKTWTEVPVPGGVSGLSSVSCSSDGTCIAVGPNAFAPSNPTAPGSFLSSSNGGQSWTPEQLPAGTAGVVSVACTATATCVATGTSSSRHPLMLIRRGRARWKTVVTSTDDAALWGITRTGAGWLAVGATSKAGYVARVASVETGFAGRALP